MPPASNFDGFPTGTLRFLRGIRKKNSKSWFEEHRSDYDEFYVAAAKRFVEAAGTRLGNLRSDIVAQPKINGSIFRINRDIRFSKDQRPYKDHLDFAFWEGEKKSSASSFFLRVSPDGVFVGAGFHQGCPEHLKSLRIAVDDQESGAALSLIAKKLRRAGYELHGQHYKRIPRGFAGDGPAAEFLLHKDLYVVAREPASCASDREFLAMCVKHWKAVLALHAWLIDFVR